MASPRIYISADIEGVTGFVHPDQDSTDEGASAMAADVNAAIEGVLAAEPTAEIRVADSHGRMRTIPLEALHDRASLVRGRNRPDGMVDGPAPETDVAFFIGYHDRPGTGGVLEHTFSGSLSAVYVNGTPVGESELNAAMLRSQNIPVGLITGDDILEKTIEQRFPTTTYVCTKFSRGVRAATTRPPAVVREEIADAAESVVANLPMTPVDPIDLSTPIDVSVTFQQATHAELACLWPEVSFGEDSRTVTYSAADIPALYQFVRATATVRPR